jgi:hypothetical protein
MSKFYGSLIDRDNEMDDYFDLDGFGLGRQSHRQLVCYDKKNLDDSLKESEETKNEELKLFMVHITSFPLAVTNFDWVETLELYDNDLTNIDDSFLYFKNLKHLSIEKNDIKHINCNNFPDTIETLILSNNNTWSVDNLKNKLLKLDLSKNNLNNSQLVIPESVIELDLSNNRYLMKNPVFMSNNNLNNLDISNTSISNIDELPDSIIILKASNCNIRYINKLPSELMEFTASSSKIFMINCQFPQNLFEIDLEDNMLSNVPNFPNTMHKIDLKNNLLEKLFEFPTTVKRIDISENPRLDDKDIKKAVAENPDVNIIYDEENDDNDTGSIYGLFGGYNRLNHNYENHRNHNIHNQNHNHNHNHNHNNNHNHNYNYNHNHNQGWNHNNMQGWNRNNIQGWNRNNIQGWNHGQNSNPRPNLPKPPTFADRFTQSNPYYIILENTYSI